MLRTRLLRECSDNIQVCVGFTMYKATDWIPYTYGPHSIYVYVLHGDEIPCIPLLR